MKKVSLFLLSLTIITFFVASHNPVKAEEVTTVLQQAPKIISITPNKIKPQGATVEILGENFGATQATYSGKLYDGHHIQGAHEILSWSDTRITAVINLAERDWLHYSPYTDLQVRVKCIDTVCKNGGQGFTNRPIDEYWSEAVGLKLDVPICTESEWSCSDWSVCSITGNQSRTCTRTFLCANAATQTSPITTQSCTYVPPCSADIWGCGEWSACSLNGEQSRSCTKTFDCPTTETPSPTNSQSCIFTPPVCTAWTYSDWTACSVIGQQTRTVIASLPTGCASGRPVLSRSCTYTPPCIADTWSCSDWNQCSSDGRQTRSCTKTFDCPSIESPSSSTSQSCTPPPSTVQPKQPSCSEDQWSCGVWDVCSPNGVQTRSCQRTFDCPSVETATPATSQYCQPAVVQQPRPPSQSNRNSSDQSDNSTTSNADQDSIIAATVKLICLVSKTSGKQGTGTMIDPKGIILTNRHVVEGTKGCIVGFINNADDDPSFDEIADIVRIANDEDIALLKIRNTNNKSFPAVNISNGVVNNRNLGDKIMIYGYPGIGGSKLNYSDGSVSGFGSARDGLGNYIKTNALIEHGNSGGGAYLLKDGSFIGVPSAGIKGELASIGYILSINKIKSWMSSSGLAYNGGFRNLSSQYIKAANILENVNVDAITVFDVSTAKVSIYSDKTKRKLLPNNPGTVQTSRAPTFQVNNIDSQTGIAGYYVYFGVNIKADPVTKGKFVKKSEYAAPTIRQAGVYYFIFRAKDKSGNISESIITEYRYKK